MNSKEFVRVELISADATAANTTLTVEWSLLWLSASLDFAQYLSIFLLSNSNSIVSKVENYIPIKSE